MSNYRIFETTTFQSDIKSLPKKSRQNVERKIKEYIYLQIIQNPYYGLNIKKLKNYQPETWRFRLGKYRLFYEIDDIQKIIFILSFDHRKDAY